MLKGSVHSNPDLHRHIWIALAASAISIGINVMNISSRNYGLLHCIRKSPGEKSINFTSELCACFLTRLEMINGPIIYP